MYQEWKRLHRTGMRRLQERAGPCTSGRGSSRSTCPRCPRFPADARYARADVHITEFQQTPDDVDEAVGARMSRNRDTQPEGRRFTMLLEESVLRYR